MVMMSKDIIQAAMKKVHGAVLTTAIIMIPRLARHLLMEIIVVVIKAAAHPLPYQTYHLLQFNLREIKVLALPVEMEAPVVIMVIVVIMEVTMVIVVIMVVAVIAVTINLTNSRIH
jgi:hypothetical protein